MSGLRHSVILGAMSNGEGAGGLWGLQQADRAAFTPLASTPSLQFDYGYFWVLHKASTKFIIRGQWGHLTTQRHGSSYPRAGSERKQVEC